VPLNPGPPSGLQSPVSEHAPSQSQFLTDILSRIARGEIPPPTMDSWGTLTWGDALLSSGSPTGSRLPVGPMTVAGSQTQLPPPPSSHLSQPGTSEDRFPSPSGYPVNPDTLSTTGNHQTPPHSPGVDPELHSLLHPESFPSEFWDKLFKGGIKRRISGSDPVNLAQKAARSRIF
jgi:hypothetical protein